MKAIYYITLVTSAALITLGCDKSPKEIIRDLTATKVQKASIIEPAAGDDDQIASGSEQPQATKTSSTEPPATSVQDAPHKMCHALLKTMKTEPYFYQFQANLRKYRLQQRHGELVKGHVTFHKIDYLQQTSHEPYEECADIVASFDRYPDVKAFWNKTAWQSRDQLERQLLSFRSGKNFYPVDRCADVIASLKDEEEFRALITELSRAESDQLPPEIMMGTLMEANHVKAKNETAMITPKGCIKALHSFASFKDVEAFATSDDQLRRERLGVHGSVMVAH